MLLRNKIGRVLTLAFLFSISSSFSQQGNIGQDFFYKNNSFYNPGFIGSDFKLNASIFSKFGKLGSNEESFFGGLDFAYSLNDKHGVSMSALAQRELEYFNGFVNFGYAYNFKFKKKNIRGGVGFKIGMKTLQQKTSLFTFGDTPDSTNILYNQNRNQAYTSVGFSFWFNEKFYLGFYGDNIVPFLDYNAGINPETGVYTYSNAPVVGVNFGVSSASRQDSAVHKLSIEVNARFNAYLWDDGNVFRVKPVMDLVFGLNIKNIVTPHFGFRYNDSDIQIIIGMSARLYKGLNIGYSYNVHLTEGVVFSKGSHEVYLGFFIPNKNRVSVPKKKK